LYPHRKDVTFFIVFSAVAFIASLFLPVLEVDKSYLVMFAMDRITFMEILWALVGQDHYTLALMVLTFSFVFPALKFAGLLWVWLGRHTESGRALALAFLKGSGKWSMADVFVVAVLIFVVKIGAVARVEAKFGIYVFAASALASMLATAQVDKLAKEVHLQKSTGPESSHLSGNDVY
jgi:paraquat-inducible protein A